MKFYRGSAAAARSYVEADHARADDYYLAEGTGLAEHYLAGPGGLKRAGDLDGPAYERWVAGYDLSSAAKGRLRDDDHALRFVEVVVNGPKSWSLAAALHPDVAEAYDAAMDRAAGEVIGFVGHHATTRVGPRGRQVQVPVEQIEAAVVRHQTSRAGDPHRHLHVQINARVFARGSWRGLHSVGVVDSIEALNGIGHAAMMCDPRFRTALAARGYTVRDDGEIDQLVPYTGRFSDRAAQIARNIDHYEAVWRSEHPGQEPGPRMRRSWDRRAWADARPDKPAPRTASEFLTTWTTTLRDLGFTPPPLPRGTPAGRLGLQTARINRDACAGLVLIQLGAKRSAWNSADIRGLTERLIASLDVVAARAARTELVEDIADRAQAQCVRMLDRDDVPAHIRSLTSHHVLHIESELVGHIDVLSTRPTYDAARVRGLEGLDPAQQGVVKALAGEAGLLVIEGAAGTGKTTTLAAARGALERADRRLVVVTPTWKAAQAAQQQVGPDAFSAAWLIHQHGYRWDADGHWSRVDATPEARARLLPGDVLLVDEAGMLDQDTAVALLTIARCADATVALLGDRHQLPAVGRGGVLHLAARHVQPQAHHELESVHRFTDPDYAALTLLMRDGQRPGDVFDALLDRGEIVIHASEVERTAALAGIGAAMTGDHAGGAAHAPLVVADTREHVSALNGAIRDSRHAATDHHHRSSARRDGSGEASGEPVTQRGERIGVGDRIATRLNDRDLGVANRDTWTVTGVRSDGRLTVTGRPGQRSLSADYVRRHVELAYATTVHGAQGETVDTAHLALGDATSAASAYVGMTRGRHHNTAHLVADTIADARRQWIDVFDRSREDLGPAHAATQAAADIDRYGISHATAMQRMARAMTFETGEQQPPRDPQSRQRGIGR